jgi:NADPH:quinone reductase-like Zn-dependent oxidoreductase
MRALCTTADRNLELRDVPTPTQPASAHVLIRMDASGINPGDIAFLKAALPLSVPKSLYDIWGVSGAGTVIAAGEGVPEYYKGKKVAVYRSLIGTDQTIGTWCEIAQMHHLACVVLPDSADAIDYSASLVNLITPYAFIKQAQQERHRGVLITAGTSATGIAMLGMALAYQIPVVSIVRSEEGKQQLLDLGATKVLDQTHVDFDRDFAAVAEAARATAIFDGVGGALLNRFLPMVARGSTVYSYGYLGGSAPVSLPTSLLMAKSLTLKGFGNFSSPTVQDRHQLAEALAEISRIIDKPHFKTKRGQLFSFAEIKAAISYSDKNGGKAILRPAER